MHHAHDSHEVVEYYPFWQGLCMWAGMALFTPRFERKSTTVPGPNDMPLTCEIIYATPRRWRRSREAREEQGKWSVRRIGPRVIATSVIDGLSGQRLPIGPAADDDAGEDWGDRELYE